VLRAAARYRAHLMMEALLIQLPRKYRASLVIYRYRKLTCLPCISPSDNPRTLLVPVQLNSCTSLRIVTVARPIRNRMNPKKIAASVLAKIQEEEYRGFSNPADGDSAEKPGSMQA
jgi:hypothetical protein